MIYVLLLLNLFSNVYALEINIRKTPLVHNANPDYFTHNKIEAFQYNSLSQILYSVPGLSVPQTNPLGEFTVWGNRSGHTMLMIDGIPQQNATHTRNGLDLNTIDCDSIDRIKIEKGVASLMQPGSMGGLIKITSQQNQYHPQTTFKADVNQYGAVHSHINSNKDYDRNAHYIGLTNQQNKPNSFYNPVHHRRLANQGRENYLTTTHYYQPHDNYEIFMKYQLSQTNLKLNDYHNNLPIISDHTKNTQNHKLQIRQVLKPINSKSTHTFNLSGYEDRDKFNLTSEMIKQKNQTFFLCYQFNQQFLDNISALIELNHTYRKVSFLSGMGGQQHQTFLKFNTVIGNIHSTNLQINLNQQVQNINNAVNPQVIGTLQLTSKLKLINGIGWSSRAASLYEYSGHTPYNILPNKALKTEHVRILESQACYIIKENWLNLNVRIFKIDYTKLIDLNAEKNRYINILKRNIKGLESCLLYKTNRIEVGVAYTFLQVDNIFAGIKIPVSNVPLHHLSSRIKWHYNDLISFFFEPSLSLSESNISSLKKSKTHNYFNLRLGGQYRVKDSCVIMLRLENAMASRREVYYGYGSPPLSIHLGCKLTW